MNLKIEYLKIHRWKRKRMRKTADNLGTVLNEQIFELL
jgi:hypothetical protein